MLKNLEKNLTLLFEKLNAGIEVEKLKKFIKEERKFYCQPVEEELFLKAKIKEGGKVLKEIKTEIKICKTLKENFAEKNRFFPKLISVGKYKNLDWFLEKKEKGIFGGEMEKDFRIKKEFLKRLKPEKFAKIIFLYQKIKPEISLYLHGGWWFERDFEYHQRNFLEKFINSSLNKNLISRKEINLAQEVITGNKKFLDSSAKFLCHGDLYPNNLILNEKGNVIILDWGLSTFNNFAFDVAFIYLMAQTIPQWQKKFLKHFLNLIKDREEFKALFRIDTISLANRFAAQCYYLKLKEKFERKTFLIFKNYLKSLKKVIYQKI